MFTQKSYRYNSTDDSKKWYLIDAENMVVGRLATQIADVLRGKTKPQYTPNIDSGDFVVVINAEKVRFTGNKLDQKNYYRHSGYVGGLKSRTAREQLDRAPEKVLFSAVKGMLPKNTLGKQQIKKLKVFAGSEHTHEAQKPEPLKLK